MKDRQGFTQRLVDALSSGIFLLDRHFSIQYLNESAEELIQCSAKRVKGLLVTEFINDADNAFHENRFLDACKKVVDDNLHVWLHQLEVLLPHAFQTKQVYCHASPMEIDNSLMVLLEILPREWSNMNNLETEWIDSNQTVVHGLAHEIRNPLGGIRGAAQLLTNDLENNPAREMLTPYTDIIIREADRLSNLVSEMQVPVSLKDKQPVNIHSILEHVRNLILSDPATKLNVVTDYDPSLPTVLGDADQLIQAFINILKNAVDSMELKNETGVDQDPITLKSRIDHLLLPGYDLKQQAVRVDVIDRGIGISSEMMDHIFKPMVTNKAKGIGLGLSITSEIIRYHGGLIKAYSNLSGAVFSVYLKTTERNEGE